MLMPRRSSLSSSTELAAYEWNWFAHTSPFSTLVHNVFGSVIVNALFDSIPPPGPVGPASPAFAVRASTFASSATACTPTLYFDGSSPLSRPRIGDASVGTALGVAFWVGAVGLSHAATRTSAATANDSWRTVYLPR